LELGCQIAVNVKWQSSQTKRSGNIAIRRYITKRPFGLLADVYCRKCSKP
jgi:hypothetical protein